MLLLIAGFIASMLHVITGPDHLAAVTPLAIDSRKKSWVIGISWGFGHTAGMLTLGLLFIFFKRFIPVDKIASHSEILVGILLIGIGSWAILKTTGKRFSGHHVHLHIHRKPKFFIHVHEHSHEELVNHQHQHENVYRKNAWTAFLVGIIHGLSGLSHLLAILPTLLLPSMVGAVCYLSGFAFGTIGTMMIVAMTLGIIAFKLSEKKKAMFLRIFSLTGGTAAILIGIFWLFQSL